MRFLVLFLAFLAICQARPPTRDQVKPGQNAGHQQPQQNQTKEDWDLGIEYNRYLQEVVQVLESDPEFR